MDKRQQKYVISKNLELRPSLIYIKKERGPQTEPCGTSVFIAFHEELLPLTTTLSLRS